MKKSEIIKAINDNYNVTSEEVVLILKALEDFDFETYWDVVELTDSILVSMTLFK